MTNWHEHLPEEIQDGTLPLTEDDVWQAIADANNLDVSEIADGDLAEWL